MGEEALWTVAEVAQFLSVTTKTVRAWQLEHKLPFLKIGGTVRFVPSEIRAWATDHAVVSRRGGGVSVGLRRFRPDGRARPIG